MSIIVRVQMLCLAQCTAQVDFDQVFFILFGSDSFHEASNVFVHDKTACFIIR